MAEIVFDFEAGQRMAMERQRQADQLKIQQANLILAQKEEERKAQEDRKSKVDDIMQRQSQMVAAGDTADTVTKYGLARAKALGLPSDLVPKWKPTDENGGYDVSVAGQEPFRVNPARQKMLKTAQFASAMGMDPREQQLLPGQSQIQQLLPPQMRAREAVLGTGPAREQPGLTGVANTAGLLPADQAFSQRDPTVETYLRSTDTDMLDKMALMAMAGNRKYDIESMKQGAITTRTVLKGAQKKKDGRGARPMDPYKAQAAINIVDDNSRALVAGLVPEQHMESVTTDGPNGKVTVQKIRADAPLPPGEIAARNAKLTRLGVERSVWEEGLRKGMARHGIAVPGAPSQDGGGGETKEQKKARLKREALGVK